MRIMLPKLLAAATRSWRMRTVETAEGNGGEGAWTAQSAGFDCLIVINSRDPNGSLARATGFPATHWGRGYFVTRAFGVFASQ